MKIGEFFKKYRIEMLIIFATIVAYFLSRLVTILSLPIFTDEAIYIRWAQIAKNDASWRFISLTDGKQPSFIWILFNVMRFVEDPLLAGRLVSVGAGFLSMVGLFFLGREIFKNWRIGIISSALYAIYPMSLVYDRMALYDGLVGTFMVWSLYFTAIVARYKRLDAALILGLVNGGAVLTKTSGFFTIYLLPLSILLFEKIFPIDIKKLLKWLSLVFIVVILTFFYYSILRLSPFYHIINQKNAIFVYPLQEWLLHPFRFFYGNLVVGEWDWFKAYLTWPWIALLLLSFVIKREYFKEKLWLLSIFGIPFVALALFGNVIYPRFIFFMTLALLPLVAYSIYFFLKIIPYRAGKIFLTFFIILFPLYSNFMILTDFVKSPIPTPDLYQYGKDWPSGGGVKETIALFKKLSEKEKIVIATQGTFGLMPYAYEIYLNQNPNITIKGFWPVGPLPPEEITELSKTTSTYVVFYQPCQICPKIGEAPVTWPVELVVRYKKPFEQKRYFSVYKLKAER